jgi:hypothetical protein
MRRSRIGVIGTVVEDTIDRPGEATVRGMGGGYHSLIAMSVFLPPAFEAVPIVNVGEDALERVCADLERMPRISLDGIHGVPAINNKVHLEYDERGGRGETLTGGVPPLAWEALAPWAGELAAWCWNFIAGNEVDRDTFERVKRAAVGPLHLDVHSLCLGPPRAGKPRAPRSLRDWEGWVEGTTWVQLNEAEAGLLWTGVPQVPSRAEEAALADRIRSLGVEGLLITRGERGATWFPSRGNAYHAPATTGPAVDPTGCGDVFGAAWVALRIGHDQDPEAAVRGAVLASGAAATVSGTARLAEVLAATMDAILHPEAIR